MLKKRCALFLALLMVVMTTMGTMSVFATEVDTTVVAPVEGTEAAGEQTGTTGTENNMTGPYDTGVPNVKLDEFEEKIESKFYKVIGLMQTGCKLLCIIFFIVGAVMTVIGLIGKGGAWKGFLAMGLSALMYTCIMYAPEIVQFIQEWTVA
jgi:hypothetical protein